MMHTHHAQMPFSRLLVPEISRIMYEEKAEQCASFVPSYRLVADVQTHGAQESLHIENHGHASAVFRLSGQGAARSYTVEAGRSLDILLIAGETFHLAGPDGFVRARIGAQTARMHVGLEEVDNKVIVNICAITDDVSSVIIDDAYGVMGSQYMSLRPGQHVKHSVSVTPTAGWYDLMVDDGQGGLIRFSGHVETDKLRGHTPMMALR